MLNKHRKKNTLLGLLIGAFIVVMVAIGVNNLAGQSKLPNEEVYINNYLILQKGYDIALSDGDDGFMYVSGTVKNKGKTIAARDLKLTFDVLSGNEVVGACFMTNPKEIKNGESWHFSWDVWLSRCITDADNPNYSGSNLEVDGVRYSTYSFGNKQYYDELLDFKI